MPYIEPELREDNGEVDAALQGKLPKLVELKDIKLFSDLSKAHCKGKKSFVLVASDIDFNAIPTQLTVVPSIQEAHDIIEMEEIERDLGF